jgi:hypothetical protein
MQYEYSSNQLKQAGQDSMKNGSDFPDNQYSITEWPNGGN